jgi:hypothetical protein
MANQNSYGRSRRGGDELQRRTSQRRIARGEEESSVLTLEQAMNTNTDASSSRLFDTAIEEHIWGPFSRRDMSDARQYFSAALVNGAAAGSTITGRLPAREQFPAPVLDMEGIRRTISSIGARVGTRQILSGGETSLHDLINIDFSAYEVGAAAHREAMLASLADINHNTVPLSDRLLRERSVSSRPAAAPAPPLQVLRQEEPEPVQIPLGDEPVPDITSAPTWGMGGTTISGGSMTLTADHFDMETIYITDEDLRRGTIHPAGRAPTTDGHHFYSNGSSRARVPERGPIENFSTRNSPAWPFGPETGTLERPERGLGSIQEGEVRGRPGQGPETQPEAVKTVSEFAAGLSTRFYRILSVDGGREAFQFGEIFGKGIPVGHTPEEEVAYLFGMEHSLVDRELRQTGLRRGRTQSGEEEFLHQDWSVGVRRRQEISGRVTTQPIDRDRDQWVVLGVEIGDIGSYKVRVVSTVTPVNDRGSDVVLCPDGVRPTEVFYWGRGSADPVGRSTLLKGTLGHSRIVAKVFCPLVTSNTSSMHVEEVWVAVTAPCDAHPEVDVGDDLVDEGFQEVENLGFDPGESGALAVMMWSELLPATKTWLGRLKMPEYEVRLDDQLRTELGRTEGRFPGADLRRLSEIINHQIGTVVRIVTRSRRNFGGRLTNKEV